MRIIVIGGGVIGCTSAYWLRLAGHEVVLIEQEVEAGRGVSAGNGGQLSYAYVEPLAGPDLWTKFPAILLGLDSAVRMRPDLSADSIRWGLSFLRHCVGARQSDSLEGPADAGGGKPPRDGGAAERRAAAVRLCRRRQAHPLSRRQGAGRARASWRRSRSRHGFRIEILDRARCLALDPALRRYGNPFAGGVHAPEDAAGDCAKFTRALYEHLRDEMGVETLSSTRVTHLKTMGGRVAGVELDTERGTGRRGGAGERHRCAAPRRHRRAAPADRAGEGLQHHRAGAARGADGQPDRPRGKDRVRASGRSPARRRLRRPRRLVARRQPQARAATAGAGAPPVPDGRRTGTRPSRSGPASAR